MHISKLKLFLSILDKGLDQVDIPILTECNLNCKYCNAFSPIADPWQIDLSEFKKDIKKFSELFNGQVNEFHILGGEPLLHPDLIDILISTREAFPKSIIKIITNGILLGKMSQDFYDVVLKYKIDICISHYPGIDIKCPIKYSVIEKPLMDQYVFNLKGTSNPEIMYENCCLVEWCISLTFYNKKLYTPCLDPYINMIKKYLKAEVPPKDSGESIYDYSSGKELLFNLFSKRPDICRFCRGCIKDLPWDKSTRDISEYTDL